jgi:hypothetical protein
MKKSLLLPLLLIGTFSFAQMHWHYVGSSLGISTNEADIEIANNGALYMAYNDPNQGGKITVLQFNDQATQSGWDTVGVPGIGYAGAYDIQLKTDGGGSPYFAAKTITGGVDIIEVYTYNGSNWNNLDTYGLLKTDASKDYSFYVSINGTPMLTYYNKNSVIGTINDLIVIDLSTGGQIGPTLGNGDFSQAVAMTSTDYDYPIIAWEYGDMSNYYSLSYYDGSNYSTLTTMGDFPKETKITHIYDVNNNDIISTSWREDYLVDDVYVQNYKMNGSYTDGTKLVYTGVGASQTDYFSYDMIRKGENKDVFFILDATGSTTTSKLITHDYFTSTMNTLSSNFASTTGTVVCPRVALHNDIYVVSYIYNNKVYVKESMETPLPVTASGLSFTMCEQASFAVPYGNSANYVFEATDDFYDHSTATIVYSSQNNGVIPSANITCATPLTSSYIGMSISGTNNVSTTTSVGIDMEYYLGGTLFMSQPNVATITVKAGPEIAWNLPKLCTNDNPVNVSQNAIPLGGTWTIDGVNTPIYDPSDCNCGSSNHILSYQVSANGCTIQKDTTIAQLFPPNFAIATSPASCGMNDGSAQTSIISGAAPFTYQWTTGSTTSSASNLSPGMYYVTVKDDEGCKRTKAAAISSSTISITGTVTPVNCNGESTGAIDVTVTGGTGQLTYYRTHGAYTQYLTNLSAGPYELSVTDASGCMSTASFIVPENAPIIAAFTNISPSCSANDGSITSTVSGGTSPYNYTWKNSLGATIGTTASISSLPADGYTLIISDANTCQKTNMVMLNNVAGPMVSLDTIINANCSSDGMINISINSANPIVSTIWSDNSTNEDLTAPEGQYAVAVTDDNGCIGHLVAEISMTQPDPIEICMVTVDTNTITNLVLWAKPASSDIHHFNIYRETAQVGLYQLIDSVLYTSLSSYNDLDASPSIRSWRYKVSAVNNCGIESELSVFHKTIHLSISQGLPGDYNLFWDNYEGFTYPNFELYRHTDLNGWELIQTMPTNLYSYTDTPPSIIGLDYMISIASPNDCTPSKAQDYNSSRSNKANSIHVPLGQGGTTGIKTYQSNNFEMELYPNPTTGILSLVWEGNNTNYQIIDLQGKLIQESILNAGKTTIDLSTALPGIYFLQINGKTNKIIVQ